MKYRNLSDNFRENKDTGQIQFVQLCKTIKIFSGILCVYWMVTLEGWQERERDGDMQLKQPPVDHLPAIFGSLIAF